MLLTLIGLLITQIAAAQAADEGPAQAPTAEEASGLAEAAIRTGQDDAREILRLARLRFERGEFDQAVTSFSSILSTPVRLSSRRDLHEGFLYYSFTLFLRGDIESASEALTMALRLDPEFAPSPVTTRPDLFAFYDQKQVEFTAAQGGVAEAPETIFPELAQESGTTVVLRRRRFLPLFGIGLRQLGHPVLGNVFLGGEIGGLSFNIASLILRAAYIEDRTPSGMNSTAIGRQITYASFGVFWGAIVADFVVSMILRRYYTRHPEKRRESKAFADRVPTRRPQLRAGPTSLTLSFW